MIRGLHAVLTAVWYSGTIPLDWKRGLVIPIWQGVRPSATDASSQSLAENIRDMNSQDSHLVSQQLTVS